MRNLWNNNWKCSFHSYFFQKLSLIKKQQQQQQKKICLVFPIKLSIASKFMRLRLIKNDFRNMPDRKPDFIQTRPVCIIATKNYNNQIQMIWLKLAGQVRQTLLLEIWIFEIKKKMSHRKDFTCSLETQSRSNFK